MDDAAPAPALSIVLPAYQEAANLGPLLDELHEVLVELGLERRVETIVVDGGSTDGTPELAAARGCRVLVQQQPGYGEALRIGLTAARAPWVLCLDADGSHPPACLAAMWRARAEADLVIASRWTAGGEAGGQPLLRRWLSRLLNSCFRTVTGLAVRDLSSGYRLYRAAALAGLPSRARGFEIQQELLLGLLARGARVREVPLRYRPRRHGRSHARVLRLGLAYLGLLGQLLLARCRVLDGGPPARRWPWVLGLCALAALAHLPGLAGGWLHWDDDELVFANPALEPLGPATLARIFDPRADRTAFGSQYTPLSDLSYAIDRALAGTAAPLYHAENLLWHLGAVALGFLLIERWRRSLGLGLAAAGLLAIHPVAVEAVAWISGRRTVMCTALMFAAMLLWLRWRERGGRAAYGGTLLLVLAANLAKQAAVVTPALLWLADRTALPRARRPAPRHSLLALLPHAALALLFVGLGWWVGRREGILTGMGAASVDPVQAALLPLGRYLGMLLWPAELAPSYAIVFASPAHHAGALALGAAVLAGGALLALCSRRRVPEIGLGLAGALIALLPALVPGRPQFVADRYLYPVLPWLGLALGSALLAVCAPAPAGGVARTPAAPPALARLLLARRAVVLVVAVGLAAVLAARTAAQSRVWRDDLTLWRHAVRLDPHNAVAQRMLGLALARAGRLPEAEQALRQALAGLGALADARARAVRAQSWLELAWVLEQLDRPGEAARARRAARELAAAGARDILPAAAEHRRPPERGGGAARGERSRPWR
ncbi:MAG: hypothetical protein KatS3mg102_1449 [Planctomycetota bacterium]|nr:MAG: hypothetical protein KatS3mg102_1449 [Planctomycetota bacterium]